MRTTHSLLVSAAIVLATPGLGVAAASTKDELTFAVSLDDKPIGMHRFRIADDGAMRVVDSEATFDVSILRVPVYRYRHRNTETWQNGCLKRIDSETDANGAPYAVDLSKTAAGYKLATPSETRTHEVNCLMSFAYWDRRFLQEKRLLNTQTGELIAVEIQSLGESKREIANLPPGDDRAGTEIPFLTLPIVFLWVACQTVPSTPIATVKHVDLERFMDD